MIALWMLAAMTVALALGAAAAAVERVARVWRRPTRHAWTAALLSALLLAAAVPVAARLRAPTPTAPPAATARDPIAPVRLAAFVVRAGYVPRLAALAERLTPLDRPLAAAWLALSALTLALVARGALGLVRARRTWRRRDVDGTAVLLADDVGPAVIGLRRPAIVLPEWALTLDAPLRALVVRHEAEHVAARDPLLLA